jgi:hypothetical protein
MAKRFAITPVIGSGQMGDSYRPNVPNGVAVSAVIPSKPDGTPKYRFAFIIFSTDNLPAVLAVTNLYCLPDYPLDARMDGMESDARTGLVQSVAAYDVDGAGLHFSAAHQDADSYRAVLTAIGQQFEPAFALNSFDVREG